MGASRKLQGEIDRVLKKVQEGVEVFDSIWKKVYDTDNANQKEKFEADLKKEIKKLQRYRDQIKTWIQSSEIKDKKALVDARKLIEREMERFKVCEKETKTKAFSKEGLGQQPKTDPKEKAKSETRDWLNNVVGELESQIDNFEAELEGLSVKKGKTRPPRLVHLETSIARHKAHIMKLELILRLLDNDELSPEQVNDVKDFLDDYVERNQEDFDEFSDVDELYSSLPLDKVETLEDLVSIGPPGLVKTVVTSPHQQSSSVREPVEDATSQDSIPETIAKTPPSKSSVMGSSTAITPAASHATSAPINIPSHNLSVVPTASAILSGSNSVRGTESTGATSSSSSVNVSTPMREEEPGSFPGLRSSPSFSDTGLVRGIGRGGISSQPLPSVPLSSNNVVPGSSALGIVPSSFDMAKRNILGADEKLGSSGMVQSLVLPPSNKTMLPQVAKSNNGTGSLDSSNVSEASSGRVLSPSMVSGMPWRLGSEAGQIRGRTETEPDQREKFMQRLQQAHHNNPLGHKQFSGQQQNPLLQQFISQNASVSQAGIGLGVQMSGLGTVPSSTLPQQTSSVHQLSNQSALVSTGAKESEVGHAKVDEQQQQNSPDDSAADPTTIGLRKNTMNEDELKAPHAIDSPVGVSGSLIELAQVSRDTDPSAGQPLQANQSSGSLGVIGRRSVSDLGAIGDNITASSTVNSGGLHDQLYTLQMLDAAYYKLPQPKDSERPRNYTPRHPAITPPSYPQVQAPIVNNPAFWERLGLEPPYGIDTLFFAFYHQQNTYQQYLAAKELKKQSWRYHKKYNTWFQRHEEPKVATDEYEQGTYVYFDFHVANDDLGIGKGQGWCQRIKTEFTFEYNYLEDELIV
ncbi:CCR4-NOT transcription complex subunit 3 isoform X2 [Morus notabilis]|uniref:CCR4-NOT transcription complex subunit 3 isoform X2 n=1 Tax=Morus notabilis TaxID=981085 RepID=UPI000CED7CB6|nr:CCR4-NOT transcription complex subunit 3 isoform X2 [Morus notabilis]